MAPARSFAQWLDATMDVRGIGNRSLARKVEVHDSIVGRWRSGSVIPCPENCSRIASALGVDVVKLMVTAHLLPEADGRNPLDVPRRRYSRAEVRRQLAKVKCTTPAMVEAAMDAWEEDR